MEGKKQFTLQHRITNFIILFIILLISAFTIIQVNNQIKTITDYNSYRAKVSVLFIKTTLERILESAEPGADMRSTFNKPLDSLKKGGLIEDGIIISKYDNIIASTELSQLGKRLAPEESITIRSLFEPREKKTDILSRLDKSTKTLFMYIPLAVAGVENYVMRATFSLGNIQEALEQIYIPIIFTVISVIIIAIIFGFMLSKTIVGPIITLNRATKDIASGNLDLRIGLKTRDELEELAYTFNDMTIALKKMRQRAEDANPLTKLPGNNVIREEVEKRITSGEKFVTVHTDLDNFKAFNDKYGINKGDEAIKITSEVLQEGLKKKGSPDDFVGHPGGDDFVFITTPEKADEVASYIIQEFDKRIRPLYIDEDLEKGYIVSKSRDGKISEFPIMTISLSGVSNIYRPIQNYAEVTNIAADVKKKVKAIEKSVYLLDKRGIEETPAQPPIKKTKTSS